MTIPHPYGFATRLNLLGLALLLLLWLPALPAAAQQPGAGDDLFTARDVPVDETADTAAAAREIAIREGQRQALARVLQRLTLREDHARLPQPSDGEIAAMVANFQIENEKTSATRYLSDLTVTFKRGSVRELLRSAAIPFSETQSEPVLVLPVLQSGEELRLFDETSPWWLAWRELQLQPNSLVPVILPLGDLQDIVAVTPEQALAGDRAALAAIGSRYAAQEVLVALALPRQPPGAQAIATVGVSLRRYGPGMSDPVVNSFTAEGGEDPQAVMSAAAAEAMAHLNEAWKQETLIGSGSEAALTAQAPLGGLEDWIALRQRLTGNPSVQGVELTAMSPREARITLHYLGRPDQLAASLAHDDVTLQQNGSYWVIQIADGGAAAAISPAAPVRTPE